MTNNPTIDGVSRELLIDCVAYLQGSHRAEVNVCIRLLRDLLERDADTSLIPGAHEFKDAPVPTKADYQKIDAALARITDAPAVERQEPVEKVDHPNFLEFAICDTCAAESLCCEVAPNEHLCGGCYWAPINEKAHADQVTALQSTNKRLTETIQHMIDQTIHLVPDENNPMWTRRITIDELQSTIARLEARIAELERGRGEPVAWKFKERVWATGLSGYVWRNQLEDEKPNGDERQIRDIDPLFTAPPAPVAAPDKYDDVLLPFLALMRAELHANAHKGDRPGWLQMDSKTAILEVFYHMGKLHQAVHRGEEAAIKEYAADVANMCMMLLDVCACLDATAALNKP